MSYRAPGWLAASIHGAMKSRLNARTPVRVYMTPTKLEPAMSSAPPIGMVHFRALIFAPFAFVLRLAGEAMSLKYSLYIL